MLTALLADPRWATLPVDGGPADLNQFVAEVRRRLRITYEPYHWQDPLLRWIDQQRGLRHGRQSVDNPQHAVRRRDASPGGNMSSDVPLRGSC